MNSWSATPLRLPPASAFWSLTIYMQHENQLSGKSPNRELLRQRLSSFARRHSATGHAHKRQFTAPRPQKRGTRGEASGSWRLCQASEEPLVNDPVSFGSPLASASSARLTMDM